MPSLAQRVKAKFPGVYDDIPDAELEKKVLAKHPEYADLATPSAPQSAPEPPQPGVVGSFGRGLAESVPFAGSADEGAGAALGAIPANVARYLANEMSGRGLIKNLAGPAKPMIAPLIDAIADRNPAALVPGSVKEAVGRLGPGGEIIGDLAEAGGTAVGTNTPEAYARLAGNVGGQAAQMYAGAKLPKVLTEGRALAAGAPELPILRNLADAKRAIETHKLKQRGARFERKYGDVVREARQEKLLERPAREAAAEAEAQSNASDLKRIDRETSALQKAQAAERNALKEVELGKLKDRVKLADKIGTEQAKEVAAAARGKGGSRTISDATGTGNKKVDASSPSTEPKPAPSAAAEEPPSLPKGQFPKLQTAEFRDLSQQLAESLGQGKPAAASPHAARLDEALAGIPSAKGPRTPQGDAFHQARKGLERARRNIERAARSGAAESDIAAMVDEALSRAGISEVK